MSREAHVRFWESAGVQFPAGARGARRRRLFREAAEWFASHDVSWPFAFENVCEALALEPEWIRRALQRWPAPTRRRAPACRRFACGSPEAGTP